MMKYVRFSLLPLVASLTLLAVPVQAITTTGVGAAGSGATAPTQQLSKKELKRQKKLQKKCAKLAAGKIKKAKKRAVLEPLCRAPTEATTPVTQSPAAVQAQDKGSLPADETNSGDAGSSHGNAGNGSGAAGGGNHGNGNNAGTSGGGTGGNEAPTSGDGVDYVSEIIDSPPIFLPTGNDPVLGDTPDGVEAPTVPPTVAATVPEPGSLALLGLGLLGLGFARRRSTR